MLLRGCFRYRNFVPFITLRKSNRAVCSTLLFLPKSYAISRSVSSSTVICESCECSTHHRFSKDIFTSSCKFDLVTLSIDNHCLNSRTLIAKISINNRPTSCVGREFVSPQTKKEDKSASQKSSLPPVPYYKLVSFS